MEVKNHFDKNENIEKSKIENDIINIGRYLEKNTGNIKVPKEKSLYYFFSNRDIYNEKGTKLKDKENYICLMTLINEYLKQNKDFIFLYFNKNNIDLIKVVFNGYLASDIENTEQKDFLLKTIKDFIPLFFSKVIFYFIYNKLSKIFRKFNLIQDKENLLIKFGKLFELWKVVYDIDNREKVNSNYFTLLGNQTLILMNLNNSTIKFHFKKVNINIEFEEDFFNMNEKNDELISVWYVDYGAKSFRYKDINKIEGEIIKNISIKIKEESIDLTFKKDSNEKNENNFIQVLKIKIDPPSNFGKIDILKNYIGKIRKIYFKIEFKDTELPKYEYEIVPSKNENYYEINTKETIDGIVKITFQPQNNTKFISSKIYNDLLYEDIRYYGGFESFIPIIKIIKYFISVYLDSEDKIQKLIDILIDIIKYIVKFIFYSKDNFENFKKILVPLIGALAEINNVLPNNMKNNLYSNNIFSLLYIIIISSSMPFALKSYYVKITQLFDINKLNLNFDEIIKDVNQLRINSYEWYIIIILIIIEFILLSFNDIKKIPKILIDQVLNLKKKITDDKNQEFQQIKSKISYFINNFINCFNYISKLENGENNLFENCEKIKDISKYFKLNIINDKDNFNLPLIMIKVYLNIINSESIFDELDDDEEKDEKKQDKNKRGKKNYKVIFEHAFNNIGKLSNVISKEIKDIISSEFGDYISNNAYLKIIFPFFENDKFKSDTELILSELIDFHGGYHNLMKNNFIFNKFWSDKKLFFDEKKKKKYLKYKSINYYTKNYQRPFIYPHLDYNYSFPHFREYQIDKDFFMEEENPDDYNFTLECPDFDSFNVNYEKKILKNIQKNMKVISYNVCLVKPTHHIKGKIFIINDNNSLLKKIIFYSYPLNLLENIPCCNHIQDQIKNVNKKEKENKQNHCFGAMFDCPEKDMNIKIIINLKDIRMILKMIYFYRKSAVEIFTKNKSYFFNFASIQSEKNCADFNNMFAFFISDFFPIVIKKESNVEIIGYSRQFEVFSKSYDNKITKYDISKEGNKFISSLFDHWTSDVNNIEFSTFDLLMYLNLLSNRSYNDLFQYPVFPVLFLFDKIKENEYKLFDRKLNLHIGFQDSTEVSKERKNAIKRTYLSLKKIYEESPNKKELEIPSYFSIHFSNCFCVNNFMIRIFPFTFLSIEQQGHGFDSSNRLFFSIENAFYQISSLKSDLRELIPEFYYFPEMFWNLNQINLGKKVNGIQVNEVEMPQDLSKIDKEKNNKNDVNIKINDKSETSEYFLACKFVENMRNLLESKDTDIVSWINIIFGPKQKYNSTKDEDLLFRYESYIDYTNNKNKELQFYSQDKISMTSVEFGITPIQTVFEGDTGVRKNKNIVYNLTFKENKELFKSLCKVYIDKINIKPEQDKKNTENKNMNIIKYSKGLYQIRNTKKTKKGILLEENKPQIKNIFLEPELNIKCIFQNENIKIIGCKNGKIEVFKINENGTFDLISQFFDHNDEINHLNYNPRLNMICSTSKDGFLNVYSLPNKLITTIPNPNKKNFGLAFLSSNPFPSIITLEKEGGNIFSYSINGFKIKSDNVYNILKINNDAKIDIYVFSYFNENGGTFKDRLIFIEYDNKKDKIFKCHFIRVPFFEAEEKTIDIKVK